MRLDDVLHNRMNMRKAKYRTHHLIGINERDPPSLDSLNVSLMKELDKQVACL
jgi:hypothetical protein